MLLLALLAAAVAVPSLTNSPGPFVSECDAAAESIAGHKAVSPGGKIPPPKKLRDVAPKYPTRDAPMVGKGLSVVEALINAKGDVQRVWVVREPSFDPPWPEFSASISAAILQWKYTPTVVNGLAVPVCMVVTTTIHWR
jgi:hypothetical protein